MGAYKDLIIHNIMSHYGQVTNVICEHCKGEGIYNYGGNGTGHYASELNPCECKDCRGTGKQIKYEMNMETRIPYTPLNPMYMEREELEEIIRENN